MGPDTVNVRNLDQIQEQEPRGRSSRLATLVLLGMGGTAVVVAGLMGAQRQGAPARSTVDPLAALAEEARAKGAAPAEKLEGSDVSFPGVLSDEASPTTALAAVKDERGRLVAQDPLAAPALSGAPPLASDSLPVIPLPAAQLLGQTTVTTQPRDSLTALAASAGQVPEEAGMAPMGSDGGYQIQVASFKDAPDADAFVADLRRRGHRAFRQAAYVPERGLWHRVRIGPFKSKFEADQYRKQFEQTERLSPFVVDPHKVRQAEETRAAKVAARVRKYGRQ